MSMADQRYAERIRIMSISAAPLVSAGLRVLLEAAPVVTLVGEAVSPAQALTQAATEQPNVILLDVLVDPDDAIDTIPELLKAAEHARLLIISGRPEPQRDARAIERGASGFVLHSQCFELLIKAIQKVHSGELWLDRSTTATMVSRMVRHRRDADIERCKINMLTRREKEIIDEIGKGLSNKEIAQRLFISDATVRNHLTSVLDKLELSNRLELAVYAFRHGLVKAPSLTEPDDSSRALRDPPRPRTFRSPAGLLPVGQVTMSDVIVGSEAERKQLGADRTVSVAPVSKRRIHE